MLSLLYVRVEAQQYFVSLPCMFLDKKTLLQIGLNPGLNLTIFQGTGPRVIWRSALGFHILGDFILSSGEWEICSKIWSLLDYLGELTGLH